MKLKQLESALQDVAIFEKPSIKWEQYPTSPHIAAHMLYTIDSAYEDIEDKVIGDLGCGTGMLGIGAQILGSAYTVGIDIDPSAIETAAENCQEYEVEIDFLNANIEHLPIRSGKHFDTVIMNPPFGTKIKGIDMIFLQKAIQMSTTSVYSLHKSSTREHIMTQATEWGAKGEVVAQLRYDLPQVHKFHKKQSVDIEVDFWRFELTSKET